MGIQFRLRELMAEKARKTGQHCTYETIRAAKGINLSTLSVIANNRARRISVDVLDGLLDYFDCEPNDLIVRTEDTQDHD